MAFLRLPMCHGRLDLCSTALLLPTDQGSGSALPILRVGALPAVAVEAVEGYYQLDCRTHCCSCDSVVAQLYHALS